MLFVYARHGKIKNKDGELTPCPKSDDPQWRRCRCPKWIDGTLPGSSIRYRKSADTRSWEKAEEKRREIEERAAGGRPAELGAARRATIAHAVAEYLQNAKDEGCGEDTLSKKVRTFQGLAWEKWAAKGKDVKHKSPSLIGWAKGRGYEFIDQLGTPELRAWRSTWTLQPLAKFKRQGMVCGFFYFCMRQGWIQQNPMLDVGRIKVKQTPTDYFPRDEFDAIIDATYLYKGDRWEKEDRFAERLRTLTLLMRWSGLAIRDAITLRRDRLVGDSIFLYRSKTGHPVYVLLPPDVAEALRSVPPGNTPHSAYFFWSGAGKMKSAVADWQRSYRRLFALAAHRLPRDPQTGKMKRCHPHMFRDTFAVELLLAGTPIEEVQMALGHKSVKTTEKSYLPWVRARQEKLEASLRRSWESAA